ncbi:hypothetical protein BDR07DRAFT_1490315 [Suillus spraguei]|nr:hypothetical protein BDR07DRAFT_1490315 [Suillus spraguei]
MSNPNIELEDLREKLASDIKEEEIEQGTPSQPPPYDWYSQNYSPGAAPTESDLSDITSDSSALSSDDDNISWTESVAARPPGFRSTDTLTAELLRPSFRSTDTSTTGPLHQPFSATQRMILVRNTAFATWTFYVYYCYTGHVSFYPLRSKDPLSRRNSTTQTLRCSPKSMYRLASKLNNTHLKALAFQAIKSNSSESNVLDEAFSWFTAQYPDIKKWS